MRRALFIVGAMMLPLAVSSSAMANVLFHCGATNPKDQCAFSILHPDGKGITNFVLKSGERHELNDSFVGGRGCVAVGPGAQVRDWPGKCTNGVSGQPGKKIPVGGGTFQSGKEYG